MVAPKDPIIARSLGFTGTPRVSLPAKESSRLLLEDIEKIQMIMSDLISGMRLHLQVPGYGCISIPIHRSFSNSKNCYDLASM